MKILLVTEWHPFSIGGVQSHVRDLAFNLSKLGHEVFIISKAYNSSSFERKGIKHITVKSLLAPLNIVLIPPNYFSLKEAIIKLKPDIIHAHHAFTFMPLLSLSIGEACNVPRILTNHSITFGFDYDWLWRPSSYLLFIHRYYISKAQVIVSVSIAADRFISKFVGKNVIRKVVPNAVDTDRFKPPKQEPTEPLILFIGRLVYRKGAHVLLRAFRCVAKEKPRAKLLIVGKGYMEPILKVLAQKLDVQDKVEFRGCIPESDKEEMYRKACIVAVPSIYGESFGLVALEAMSSGRPVVASNVGGLNEIIDQGNDGLLVKAGSHRELANAIITLLSDDRKRKKMSLKAREKVLKKYSWNIVIRDLLEVYSQALGKQVTALLNRR